MTYNVTVLEGKKSARPIFDRAIVLRFDNLWLIEPVKEDVVVMRKMAESWSGEMVPAFVAGNHDMLRGPVGKPLKDNPYEVPVGCLPYDPDGMEEAFGKLKHARSLRLERNFHADPK